MKKILLLAFAVLLFAQFAAAATKTCGSHTWTYSVFDPGGSQLHQLRIRCSVGCSSYVTEDLADAPFTFPDFQCNEANQYAAFIIVQDPGTASPRYGLAKVCANSNNLNWLEAYGPGYTISNLSLNGNTINWYSGYDRTSRSNQANCVCTSNAYSQCYQDDRWWYNSCNVKEGIRQDCGDDDWGNWSANYCKNNDIYHSRDYHDRGCSADQCFDTIAQTQEMLIQDCGAGCICAPSVACNCPPSATLNANPTSSNAPLDVTFSGGCADPENKLTSCIIDFGDGSTPANFTNGITHQYNNNGSYLAVLTATDNVSLTDDDSELISVNVPPNPVPVAQLTADITSGNAPLRVTFTGGCADNPMADLQSCEIDFGDGSSAVNFTSGIIHLYAAGPFEAVLTAIDSIRQKGEAKQAIAVNDLPVADAGNDQTVLLTAFVTLTSNVDGTDADNLPSYDPEVCPAGDGDGCLSYDWSCDTFSPASCPTLTLIGVGQSKGKTATFTAGAVGEVYIFKLEVTDISGGPAFDTVQVTVSAVPVSSCTSLTAAPSASFGPFTSKLTAEFENADRLSVDFDCGNGATGNSTISSGVASFDCLYGAVATQITYSISAAAGSISCQPASVTVNAAPPPPTPLLRIVDFTACNSARCVVAGGTEPLLLVSGTDFSMLSVSVQNIGSAPVDATVLLQVLDSLSNSPIAGFSVVEKNCSDLAAGGTCPLDFVSDLDSASLPVGDYKLVASVYQGIPVPPGTQADDSESLPFSIIRPIPTPELSEFLLPLVACVVLAIVLFERKRH